MRGICVVGLGLAVMLAMAPEVVAQERGGTTNVDPPKKDKPKKGTGKKTKRTKRKPKASSGTYVEIDVRSQPRGATIVIDGERVGTSPVKARVPTGRRVIEARLSGHVTARTTIKATTSMGYLVFSLARSVKAPKVAETKEKPRASGFGTSKLSYDDAMSKARLSLKRDDHAEALKYAEAALAKKSSDAEALMIATIAACGVGDTSLAKQYVPKKRGSYREIAIKRCERHGIQLQ